MFCKKGVGQLPRELVFSLNAGKRKTILKISINIMLFIVNSYLFPS